LSTWPNSDPVGDSAPKSIEGYLKRVIRSEEVSLLGEIDLATPRDYAGINWSLLDLANYQINNRVILKDLEAKQHQLQFPATIAIWAVGHAQTSDEGGKLWDLLEEYSSVEKGKFAKKFTESMDLLNFDLFTDELQEAQKHAQLASIHAMIPDFAIVKFGDVVAQGARLNSSKEQILENILQDVTISKGVARLFSARQEMALDLVERTFNFIAYGYEVELPDRILSKLSTENRKSSKKTAGRDFPDVRFYESDRYPTIFSSPSWTFETLNGEMVDPHQFGPVKIFAKQESSESFPIFDPAQGYLVFSDDGKIQRGKRLPEHAGFVLWSEKTRILTQNVDLDQGYLIGSGWENWNYAYFQKLERLDLALDSGEIVSLRRPERLSIEIKAIPNLVDFESNSVLSSYPTISAGQNVKVIDNIQNTRYRIDESDATLGSEPQYAIDFTVSAGLGRSTAVRGIVVPGMEIRGLEHALIHEEKRELDLELPDGWHFNYPINLKDEQSGKMPVSAEIGLEIIEFADPSGLNYTTYLEIPVLSWSLVFNDRENQNTGSETKLLLEDRKHIESLIIHGITDYQPLLKIGDTSKVGRLRGPDLFFDLRFLQQDNSKNETVISISWNYQTLNLLSFRKLERRKPISLTSFSELGKIDLVEAGLFTVEDLTEYQKMKHQEHLQYRDRLRSMRGRY